MFRVQFAGSELAGLGPHQQTNLPPIPFAAYAPPRPPDVVTAAYLFAAEHPEAIYPTLEAGPPHLAAEAVAHPLLPAATAVGNDVSLGDRAPRETP